MENYWRKCSSCKKEISFKSKYYECSVSTCTGKRTGFIFCSIPCFEVHLPGARHKNAAAIENFAPSHHEAAGQMPASGGGQRRIITTPSTIKNNSKTNQVLKSTGGGQKNEILIVASKLKKYVQDEAGMNTSQSVMSVLSDIVRNACDQAIQRALNDGRKTVLDRDFKK